MLGENVLDHLSALEAPKTRLENTILDHLSTLQPDDFERVELSKKISWILRHGAWSSSGGCENIKISDDGWVLASDLLHIADLQGLSLKRLLEVIDDSNKQKWRYETRESKDGMLIRASGKKGRLVRDKAEGDLRARDAPRDSAATPSKGSGGKGGGKGVGKKGGRVEKENGKSPDKLLSKPPGILESMAPQPAMGAKDPRPAPHESDQSTSDEAKAAAEVEKRMKEFLAAAPAKKKAAPEKPPVAGVDAMSAWMAQMAAAEGPFPGMRPPGVFPPASAIPHLQFMHQMQAMQQMMAAGAMHQMQVRRVMQMQMVRQFQEAHQMQAMQVNAMRQWQEMQAFYESMEWDEEEEEEEEEDDEGEDEDGEVAAKVPETAEELEARIQEVLSAAMARSDVAAKAKLPKATNANLAATATATEAAVEAKIAEALQAAAVRNGAAKAAKAAAAEPAAVEVARPKPARPHASLDAADMEAKIAEALLAAKSRGAASTAPKVAQPVKPRPQPKKTPEADPNASIEDKIAKALEAAKERRATTK